MDRDKILIIDDSAVQAEFLKSILKEEYEVTTCQTATVGLKQAQSGEYSLILLDVVMPDMDGFTLLRELKSAFQTRHIPVIMLTSLSDVHNEEKGLLLGAVDYVAKPFSPIIIRARVKTHIDLYHFQMQFMEQALVDELTGIPNRRRYESDSVMNWRKAIRFGCPFSVCMIDIDQFKLYNDSFGHPAGDKVIASVAQVIASHLRRATDFFARYGGEGLGAVPGQSQLGLWLEHIQPVLVQVGPQNPAVAGGPRLCPGTDGDDKGGHKLLPQNAGGRDIHCPAEQGVVADGAAGLLVLYGQKGTVLAGAAPDLVAGHPHPDLWRGLLYTVVKIEDAVVNLPNDIHARSRHGVQNLRIIVALQRCLTPFPK